MRRADTGPCALIFIEQSTVCTAIFRHIFLRSNRISYIFVEQLDRLLGEFRNYKKHGGGFHVSTHTR